MTQDRIAAPSAAPIATGNRVCTEPSERAAAVPSRTRWLITWRTRPMAISRADCLAAVTPPAWHGGAPAGTSSQQKRGAESATAVLTILSPPGGQPFGLSHVQTAWRRTFSRSDARGPLHLVRAQQLLKLVLDRTQVAFIPEQREAGFAALRFRDHGWLLAGCEGRCG